MPPHADRGAAAQAPPDPALHDALAPGGALRAAILALADAAGAAIMQVYAGPFEVEHKADASPLTQADLAAHDCIVAGLARLTPGIPVLSEESADSVPTGIRRTWPRLWLVDPLDGTREFVKRNGEFSVNIALVEDGVVTFAVIQAPVTGVAWHAQLGSGAFRRDDAAAGNAGHVRITTRVPAPDVLRIAASRSHRDARTQACLDRIGASSEVALGSSLKFCAIAEGSIDCYPRFGPTSEWDTAAGQCIVEAAGGALFDRGGAPFRYNQRDTLLNGDFIALGDRALPWRGWLA